MPSICVPITPVIDDGIFIGTLNTGDQLSLSPEPLVSLYPLDPVWDPSSSGTWTADGNDKVIMDNTDSGNYYLALIHPINQDGQTPPVANKVTFRLIVKGENIASSSDDFAIKLILTDSGGLGGTQLGSKTTRFPAGTYPEMQVSLDITPSAPAHWLYAYIFTRNIVGKITMWNAEVFQDGDTQKTHGEWLSAPIDLVAEANIPITTGSIPITNVKFAYGNLANVDGMGSIDYGIEQLDTFDIIVTHQPNMFTGRSTAIITALHDKMFGYAQAGESSSVIAAAGDTVPSTIVIPALIAAAKSIMDDCATSGYQGVFFDMFGYDWGITRAQQNELIDYAHSKSLIVFANAWVPATCLDDAVDATYNPGGAATTLTTDDWVLLESYYIYGATPPDVGGYAGDSSGFASAFNKYKTTMELATPLGVKVCGLTYALSTTPLTDTTDWTNAYILAVGLGMQGLSYTQHIESDDFDWPLSTFTPPKTGSTLVTSFTQIDENTYEAATSQGILRFIATDSPISRLSETLRIPDKIEIDLQFLPSVVAQQYEALYFTSVDGETWTPITSLVTSDRYFQIQMRIRG